MTILKSSSQSSLLNCGRVYPDSDVSHHTLGHILAVNRNDRDDGVITICSVLAKDGVDSIGGAVNLCMRGIGLQSHDLFLKLLFKVYLAGADCVTVGDGAVFTDGPVGVNLHMDVDGSFNVESCAKASGISDSQIKQFVQYQVDMERMGPCDVEGEAYLGKRSSFPSCRWRQSATFHARR